VHRFLSIDDLFTAGLGFDVAGAVLLGIGLLLSPREIAWRAASWTGYSGEETVALARSRFDAIAGFTALGVGFSCQAAAYATILGGTTVARSGWKTATGAVVAAVAASLLTFALWRALRSRAVNRLLVEIARWHPNLGGRQRRPSLERLYNYALALRYPSLSQSVDSAEQRRVVSDTFGVEDAVSAEDQAAGD
jgi:hypothetical protein